MFKSGNKSGIVGIIRNILELLNFLIMVPVYIVLGFFAGVYMLLKKILSFK